MTQLYINPREKKDAQRHHGPVWRQTAFPRNAARQAPWLIAQEGPAGHRAMGPIYLSPPAEPQLTATRQCWTKRLACQL